MALLEYSGPNLEDLPELALDRVAPAIELRVDASMTTFPTFLRAPPFRTALLRDPPAVALPPSGVRPLASAT